MIAYCQDCDTYPVVTRGRCRRCYEAWRRTPDFVRIKALARGRCRLCGEPTQAKGLCGKHWIANRRASEKAERAAAFARLLSGVAA
jgi:hypothetical protein